MKEGSEALMGGPLLNLFVGPALSAFRLRLPGRDPTPAPLEDMLFSHVVHWHLSLPRLPSKGLSAAAQLTCGGFLTWEVGTGDGTGRVKEGERETRCVGYALGPVFGFYFSPHCSLIQLLASITKFTSAQSHPPSSGHTGLRGYHF